MERPNFRYLNRDTRIIRSNENERRTLPYQAPRTKQRIPTIVLAIDRLQTRDFRLSTSDKQKSNSDRILPSFGSSNIKGLRSPLRV
jgi:acetyl-CoA carboxylase alpha subunit